MTVNDVDHIPNTVHGFRDLAAVSKSKIVTLGYGKISSNIPFPFQRFK